MAARADARARGDLEHHSDLDELRHARAPTRRRRRPTGSPRSPICEQQLEPLPTASRSVDTAEHWAAAYFPDAGIPIVRGWYRQSDFPQNELLYDATLGARAYDAWLRQHGGAVTSLVADAPPSTTAPARRRRCVRSGRSGLVLVNRFGASSSIYELPARDAARHRARRTPAVVGLQSQRLIVALVDAPRHLPRAHPLVAVLAARRAAACRDEPDGMTAACTARRAGSRRPAHSASNVTRGLETLAGQTPRDGVRLGMPLSTERPQVRSARCSKTGRSLAEQLDELGAQLDWVREYL